MQFTRHPFSIVMFSMIMAVYVFSGSVYGRSLYAITTCNGTTSSTLTAYDIVGEQIEYQIDTQIDRGAIGLALDPDSETLFATYDEDFGVEDKILLINAKTMQQVKFIDISDELAGIVYDQSKGKIYAVSREDSFLYVYLWNPISKSLALEKNETLENIDPFNGAYGLALDEENSILYVTDDTNEVKFYDITNNFAYKGSIDVNKPATGIDFYPDGQGNKYLYTGRYSHGGHHEFLVRTDINDVNNPISTKKDIGSYVVGLAADRQTGLIYVTDMNDGGNIKVFNNATFPSDPCFIETEGIDGPADIVVHPSVFYLEKADVNEPNCVIPGDYITYTISYANPVTDSCDPNFIGNVNDAVITDCLPDELIFNSASGPNSVYDPYAHAVTWDIGTVSPGDTNSVTLTVKVDECIPGCGIITNSCKIKGEVNGGDLTLRWACEDTPVCSASSPEPACGEIIVDLGVGEFNLSWCPGLFAADHEVYLGSSFDDVNDANNSWPLGGIYKGTVTNPSYSFRPSSLDLRTTYYWRIDEVNEPNVWRGGVWSFTTDNYFVVDNFDSYEDTDDLEDTWDDYYENDTAAFLDLIKPGDASQRPVRNGNSMQYKFANHYSPHYSVAEADVCDLPSGIDPDWSVYEELVLWFYGQEDNPVNSQMYISLTDGDSNTATVPYGDMNDIRKELWQEWNIDLQQFLDDNDVNLADVATIAIGFGDGSGSDDGIVYFEDIRLYLRSCFPGYDPVADFDLDCDVDFSDFAIFSLAWLTDDPNISLDDDNDVDMDDLAIFCDDWVWQRSRQMPMGSGFGGAFHMAAPLEQARLALEPVSQPQFQPLAEADIEELADWLQELWLTDEELTKTMDEDEWRKFIKAFRQSLLY